MCVCVCVCIYIRHYCYCFIYSDFTLDLTVVFHHRHFHFPQLLQLSGKIQVFGNIFSFSNFQSKVGWIDKIHWLTSFFFWIRLAAEAPIDGIQCQHRVYECNAGRLTLLVSSLARSCTCLAFRFLLFSLCVRR